MKYALAIFSTAAALIAATPTTSSASPAIKSMETRGYQTAYIDVGEGDALVLIHGLGADLTRFAANIEFLSRNHRVIAIDLVGFGRSAKPQIKYRAQHFVDQIDAVLKSLGIARATLVGNSMGGWVSMLYAEQHPEKVDRLVLIAPAFVYGLPDAVTAKQLIAGAAPMTVEQMQGYLGRVYADPPEDEDVVTRLLREHVARNADGAIRTIARSIKAGEDTFTPDRVASLETETLIVHGEDDGIVPISVSEQLVAELPNAQLRVIAAAGHWPQLEQSVVFNSLFESGP